MSVRRLKNVLSVVIPVVICVVACVFVARDFVEADQGAADLKAEASEYVSDAEDGAAVDIDTTQASVQGTHDIDPYLLRHIDFDKLTATNSDATRWLFVPDTAIDAPVMQEQVVGRWFYNLRGLNKRGNGRGSFLVPAEPAGVKDDAHLMILGHRMPRYTTECMFSKLEVRWGSEAGARQYPYIYTYEKGKAHRWRVWCGAHLDPSDEVYNLPQERGSDSYQHMLDHLASVCRYQLCEEPDKQTTTLILSTCDKRGHDWGRYVVVCVPDLTYDEATGSVIDDYDNNAERAWQTSVTSKGVSGVTV